MYENASGLLIPPQCESPVQTECIVSVWLWILISPVLLVLGSCGNILNLVVLLRKKIRAHSTTIYLLFLAIADLTVLWWSLMRHFLLRLNGTDIKNWSIFNCMVHEWLSYTMGGFSIWMLVLLTTERTLFTVFPVYARERVTRKKTTIAVLILLGILALFSSHLLFTYEFRTVKEESYVKNGNDTVITYGTVCTARTAKQNKFVKGNWRVLLMVFVNFIPLIFVVIGNIIIGLTLIVQKRNRRLRVHPETQRSTILDEKRQSAARMLFFLCSFFVFTTVPFSLFGVIKGSMFTNVKDKKVYARLQLVETLVHILLYCNFTFNFLLYFVSGSLFKQEWKKMVVEVKFKFTTAITCMVRKRDVQISVTETNPKIFKTTL